MEIRNALKKIDNYLSVVQNLNKTILEEGTMAPDELKLMKKYLRGCIERIEEIEQKLNIAEPLTEKEEKAHTIIPEEIVDEKEIITAQPQPLVEDELKEEWLEEHTSNVEIIEPVVNEQVIIDPEDTNVETEQTMIESEALPVEESIRETVLPVAETVVETIAETNTTPFQLVAEENEDEEQVIGEQKRTWADLWEDQKEPVNNGLVKEDEEEESIPVIELPKNMAAETKAEEVRHALVSQQDEEEEVYSFVPRREETTVNDVIQTTKQTGLFETFHAPQSETVQVKNTVVTPVTNTAETDVLVAEVETKHSEFFVNEIFNKVRTGSEERIKAAKTLSESIALNDKFIFVRELFGNQFNEYENALRTLDGMNSYAEADQYCKQNLQEKFKWNDRPANAEKFYALLDRRFNS